MRTLLWGVLGLGLISGSAFSLSCSDEESSSDPATTADITAVDAVEQAAGMAVEEAEEAAGLGEAGSGTPSQGVGISCDSGVCTVTEYESLSGGAKVTGTIWEDGSFDLVVTFDNYNGISGTVTGKGSGEASAIDLKLDVTYNGTPYTANYKLDTEAETRSGRVNGRLFAPPADDDDDGDDGDSGDGFDFSACSSQSPDPCVATLCAYQQGYNACVEQSGASAAICRAYITCAEDFINCICSDGEVTENTSAIQQCTSTYLSCAGL